MGWKVEGGEKGVSFFPSKGNQTCNILRVTKLGTFHWPPSYGFPSPPSFLFSLKVQIWIFCFCFCFFLKFFLLDVIFDLNIWKLVPTTFLGRKRMISLNRWWKKENRLDDNNTFEIMEMSKGRFGVWNFKEIS